MLVLTESQKETLALLCATPGVKISEIRAAAQLPPLNDPRIDDIIVNLPASWARLNATD